MQTQRRALIDRFLLEAVPLMKGDVLDIGGKKQRRRGNFTVPLSSVSSWRFLNTDASTNPDFCCDAGRIPVENGSFDTALMCEVIEHLENPDNTIKEAFRVLKDNGIFIITAPFLFPYHADPHDFQRYTHVKLKSMLEGAGFRDIEITSMGGAGSVIHDILFAALGKVDEGYLKTIGYSALRISRLLFIFMDRVFKSSERFITTGYFIVAKK